MKVFLAKPNETIQEHTNRLLVLLDNFIYKKSFTKEEIDLIALAAKVHDLGKINRLFQTKISEGKMTIDGEIPHGILSCAFLDSDELLLKYGEKQALAVIMAVYNHHTRDVDVKNYQITDYIEKYLIDEAKDYDEKLILHPKTCKYGSAYMQPEEDVNEFYRFFAVIKGMLNKLDYAASAHEDDLDIAGVDPTLKIKKCFKVSNFQFNDCQKYMMNAHNQNIIVVASTGSGKTEGALLWARDSKTFYTLPLKVSINAIYKRIANNYYDEHLLKHLHSDTLNFLLQENEEDNNKKSFDEIFYLNQKIRALKRPLSISTLDQLLPFVFKAFGTEMLIATLKYSKLIIDEIQSYSPKILAYIVFALSEITKLGGQFCIMTATFPPFLERELDAENIKFLSPQIFPIEMNRHHIKISENDFDYQQIYQKGLSKKVLIICNTVKKSQEVYKAIADICPQNVNLLHARFTKKGRLEKEKEILKFSKTNDASGIWISTQIVEASLDIDFDYLYTEMSTADSLLQRLGRCYRKREYNNLFPNVYVITKASGIGTVYDQDLYELSLENLKKYDNQVFTEEMKFTYIENVYSYEIIKKTKYYKTFRDALCYVKEFRIADFSKNEAKKYFREITSFNVIPDKVFNDEKMTDVIENFNFVSKNRSDYEIKEKLYQKIHENTISVSMRSKSKDSIYMYIKELDIYRINAKYSNELGLEDLPNDEEQFY